MSVYAIVVGVNHYTAPTKYGLKSLEGAINDAEEIAKWLKDTANVEEKNLHLLTSVVGLESVLKMQIDKAIAEIYNDILSNNIQAKRLYFYFAGHGFGVENDNENNGLCMSDYSFFMYNAATLSTSDYKRKFLTEGLFEEVIFWLDCCRDVMVNAQPGLSSGTNTRGKNNNPKYFMAFATQYRNVAMEALNDSQNEYRGIFTKELLKGLNGRAIDNNLQKVTCKSLADYLDINVPIAAREQGYTQAPTLLGNTTTSNKIIFT